MAAVSITSFLRRSIFKTPGGKPFKSHICYPCVHLPPFVTLKLIEQRFQFVCFELKMLCGYYLLILYLAVCFMLATFLDDL